MNEKATLTPEVLVPRLGDYLVEKQLITQETLQKALQTQKQMQANGNQAPLLGELLIRMGALKAEELDQAITEQILQLRTALQDANQRLELRVQQRTRELEKAMQKLAELNQLKSNFVSNISHELLTPLTHIRGYLELMQNGDAGPITDEQKHFIDVMLNSSNRLERLIQDLINFSASEHGQLRLHFQPIYVFDLCNAAIEKMRSKALEKGIQLILEDSAILPFIEGDQEKLLWVLIQFIDNAIKFSETEGKVIVRAKVDENARKIRLSIIDNGIGIPAERIQEIFEPFHQLDSSSTRKVGGTGLGLALAQKIIEAHDSQLDVKSEVGKGSTFSFAIKCVADPIFSPLLEEE
ncbi:MAG: HAMP domain-containing sensor histidine kinase [Anaerolineaceae bacterium]